MTVRKIVAILLIRGMECQRRGRYRTDAEKQLWRDLNDYINSDEDE